MSDLPSELKSKPKSFPICFRVDEPTLTQIERVLQSMKMRNPDVKVRRTDALLGLLKLGLKTWEDQ